MECIDKSPLINAPEILYHYTTMEGLIGILQAREIWATHIFYLNDFKEFIYSQDLLNKILPEQRKNFKGLVGLFFAIEIENIFKDFSLLKMPFYIVSFSANGNQLSQWRAYSEKGSGFCIGFETEKLINIGKELNLKLESCIYDDNLQHEKVESLVKKHFPELELIKRSNELDKEDKFHKELDEFVINFFNISTILKDRSFEEENEWRMISPLIGTKNTQVFFRSGKSTVIPFIKFRLDLDGSFPIREINVGPTQQSDLSINAVRLLLSSEKIKDVDVKSCGIPYRGW
jgi:Protein of unknown function (DUF2971)